MNIGSISSLSDEEFYPLYRAFIEDEPRRAKMGSIPRRIDELNREYLTFAGCAPGDPWRRPEGPHDAYPKDWTVTHQGQAWSSTRAGNADEPGTSPAWTAAPPADG